AVTRKNVAGIEVALLLLFWLLNRASSSFCKSAARPFFSAASNAFMVGPYYFLNSSTNAEDGPGKLNVNVSRANDIFSSGTPALANRSITLVSMPHVIGLTKPSGGGGV